MTDFKSKHGGVLIAVKSYLKHENLGILLIHDDFIVVKINLSMSSLKNCCIYNAPAQSNYRWAVNDFLNLLEKLKNFIVDTNSLVVLSGDINFTEASWANRSSTNDYDEIILDQFIENDLSNVAPSQLDVFLRNNPKVVLIFTYNRSLFKSFSINKKPCSDHFPICTQINFLLDAPLIQASDKFA